MKSLNYESALVTGGAGFIGSHIVDRLLEEGLQVTVLDHFSREKGNLTQRKDSPDLRLVKGELQDEHVVSRAVQGMDLIFHNAAFGPVTRTIEEPEMTNVVNIGGTLNLLKAAVANKVKRFIFASTCSVYGVAPAPFKEEGSLIPVTPYGASKIAGEAYCSTFFHLYGLETVCLRYFNAYGPRNPTGGNGGLITKVAEKMIKGEPIIIHGDGRQTRDFTYVSDIVQANVLAASGQKAIGRAINVGTGIATSVNQVVDIVESVLDKKGHPRIYTHKMPEECFQNYADLTSARQLLGYEPQVSLQEGIRRYVRWLIDAEQR